MKLVSLTPVAVMLAAVSTGAAAGPVESAPVPPVAAQNPEGGCGDMGQKPAGENRQDAKEGGCGGKGQSGANTAASKPAGASREAAKVKEGACGGEGMCGARHKHQDSSKKNVGSTKKAK